MINTLNISMIACWYSKYTMPVEQTVGQDLCVCVCVCVARARMMYEKLRTEQAAGGSQVLFFFVLCFILSFKFKVVATVLYSSIIHSFIHSRTV